jgi:hypothetical protein
MLTPQQCDSVNVYAYSGSNNFNCHVEYSHDDSVWTPIGSAFYVAASSNDTYSFPQTTARYWRVVSDATGQQEYREVYYKNTTRFWVPDTVAGGGPGSDTTAIHEDVDAEISTVAEKTVPIGADLILIEDSAASNAKKRVQITNLPVVADADAIHDNVDAEISAIAAKGTPTASDFLLIEDAADTDAKKRITIGDLPGGGSSPLTTKGDVYGYDSADARIPVGANDQVLTADSAQTLGVKWADAAAGGGTADVQPKNFSGVKAYRTTNQTITTATSENIEFTAEEYDTDSYHDNSTNPERLVAPYDGHYLIQSSIRFEVDTNSKPSLYVYKNGTTDRVAATDLEIDDFVSGGYTTLQISVTVQLVAGDYVLVRVLNPAGTDKDVLAAQSGSADYFSPWVTMTLIEAGTSTFMFDLLHSKKTTADTPDDEFDSTTLDAKWTAVSGSTGTVDLLETGNVEKYDLSTRLGWLLMQVGSDGLQQVALRQDFTLPDGASIVMAIAPNIGVDGNTGVISQDRIVITVNDSDTTSRTGTFLELNVDSNTDQFGVSAWDGTSSESTYVTGSGIGHTDMIFLRIARSGTTYYPFYSTSGGASWIPLSDGHALGSAMDNLWIGFENYAAHDALTPIAAIAWIRQGTNDLDPWNPTAAVAVSAGLWEDWIDVDGGVGFQNSWVNFGSVYAPAEYRKHSDGMVQVRGMIKSGTTSTASFTLPSGYRPPYDILHGNAESGITVYQLEIQQDGDVQMGSASTTWANIDIAFDSTDGS